MTTGRSRRLASGHMRMAEQAAADSEFLLEDGRLEAAANRAYYAMFHAALAALAHAGIDLPKTHRGAVSLFGEHCATDGGLTHPRFAAYLRQAQNLQRSADYDPLAMLSGDEATNAVKNAQEFVAEIKRAAGL